MRPDERDHVYLCDMLRAANNIRNYVRGKTLSEYLVNRMLRSAVERELEIIGEAARRISPTTREKYPEIPWHPIVGQRNILAHQYDQVLHETVYGVAVRRIPELVEHLQRIVGTGQETD
jgi:uncharacterized protein with HEPN domain